MSWLRNEIVIMALHSAARDTCLLIVGLGYGGDVEVLPSPLLFLLPQSLEVPSLGELMIRYQRPSRMLLWGSSGSTLAEGVGI